MTLLNIFRPNDSKNISASFLFLKLKLNRKIFFWSNFSPVFFCWSIFSAVEPKKFGLASVWFGLMPFGPTPSCRREVQRWNSFPSPPQISEVSSGEESSGFLPLRALTNRDTSPPGEKKSKPCTSTAENGAEKLFNWPLDLEGGAKT